MTSIAQQLRDELPQTNQGLPEIENYAGLQFPTQYEVDEVLGDIIMAEFVDCNDEGYILRDGIYVDNDITKHLWRIAKVIKFGRGCSDVIEEGKLIMFPSDKGIPVVSHGRPCIFLNEERIFGIVKEV